MSFLDIFKSQSKPNWFKMMPKEIVGAMEMMIKSNPQACTAHVIPEGVGRFGLEKSNPIPVYGVPENEVYLSRLRLMNGERVRWRRIGSSEIANIHSPIDEYEIFNLNGDTITYLYISPYHLKTSKKAPQGFKIV